MADLHGVVQIKNMWLIEFINEIRINADFRIETKNMRIFVTLCKSIQWSYFSKTTRPLI